MYFVGNVFLRDVVQSDTPNIGRVFTFQQDKVLKHTSMFKIFWKQRRRIKLSKS